MSCPEIRLSIRNNTDIIVIYSEPFKSDKTVIHRIGIVNKKYQNNKHVKRIIGYLKHASHILGDH